MVYDITKDLQKVMSIIVSKEDKGADQIRAVIEKNPYIVHAKISNDIIRPFTHSHYDDNMILLHVTAKESHIEIAQLLIEKGADVNAVSSDLFQSTPLHEVAMYGNKEIVELLLKCNANIESKGDSGRTPLHCASEYGNEEAVKLLLEKGADANAVTSAYSGRRETALHKSLCHLKIVKMLLDNGADTEIEDRDHNAPLHKAVIWGYNIKAIKLLLDAQANVNARGDEGKTPLHVVVNGVLESLSEKTRETAELLLKYGADVHAKDEYGNTPLHYAAYQRSEGVVKLLLEYGANINETNNYRTSPLRKATLSTVFNSINDELNCEPVVRFLIEQTLKRNPSTEKPDFLKEMENSGNCQEELYSDYWDKCQLDNTKAQNCNGEL